MRAWPKGLNRATQNVAFAGMARKGVFRFSARLPVTPRSKKMFSGSLKKEEKNEKMDVALHYFDYGVHLLSARHGKDP
jgi:hypothetical protein